MLMLLRSGEMNNKPKGEFKCLACERVWQGDQLMASNRLGVQWTCGSSFCGGCVAPVRLKAFTNGTETHVAYSIDDALAVFKEIVGDDCVADGYGEAGDWYEADLDAYLTIFFEDKTEKDFVGEGFEIVENEPERFFIRVKAQNKDWVKWNGRGFLCSTEY